MNNTWNQVFTDRTFCSALNPERFVRDNMAGVPVAAGPVLDVGCGIGRHLVYLAALGYQVHGIDLSGEALDAARRNVRAFGLRARLEQRAMWDIPAGGERFAAALAINVLDHGMPEEIRDSVAAIHRSLVPGGLLLLSLRTVNDYRRSGQRVGPSTFICDRGPEAGSLHTLFTEVSARALLEGLFRVERLETARERAPLPDGEELNHEVMRIRAARLPG